MYDATSKQAHYVFINDFVLAQFAWILINANKSLLCFFLFASFAFVRFRAACRHFSSSFSITVSAGVRIDYRIRNTEHTRGCFVALVLAFSCLIFFFNFTATAVSIVFFPLLSSSPLLVSVNQRLVYGVGSFWYAAAADAAAYLAAIYFAIFSFIHCVAMA